MERIWLKSYSAGVPTEVDVRAYRSIIDLFERSVAKFSDKPAFIQMGATLTYAEVDRLSRDFAVYLSEELKLQKGARVALMMLNIFQYPIALLGALRAGYVVVNCNPLYTARELERQLADSGAETIVIIENFAVRSARSAAPDGDQACHHNAHRRYAGIGVKERSSISSSNMSGGLCRLGTFRARWNLAPRCGGARTSLGRRHR